MQDEKLRNQLKDILSKKSAFGEERKGLMEQKKAIFIGITTAINTDDNAIDLKAELAAFDNKAKEIKQVNSKVKKCEKLLIECIAGDGDYDPDQLDMFDNMPLEETETTDDPDDMEDDEFLGAADDEDDDNPFNTDEDESAPDSIESEIESDAESDDKEVSEEDRVDDAFKELDDKDEAVEDDVSDELEDDSDKEDDPF